MNHTSRVAAAALAFVVCSWAQKSAVVFDVDFTKGQAAMPANVQVTGGQWRGGWEVDNNGQRIIIDAGRTVRNGAIEVTFTRTNWTDDAMAFSLPEWLYNAKVINFYEDLKGAGDVARVQVYSRDRWENGQGILSIRAKEQGTEKGSGWSKKFGRWSDYAADGKTPMTVRFEWKGGGAAYTGVKGEKLVCPNDCNKQIDAIRYAVIGGDLSNPGSALGMRFLGVRMVDLDAGPVPAPRSWAQVTPQRMPQLPAETVPSNARKRVVYNLDLQKGASVVPKTVWVRGGAWENGWVVKADRERMVLDPGYWIRNGAVEVSFTRSDVPLTNEKVDVVSIHETPNIDHTDVHGDAVVLRLGTSEVNMGLQAGVKSFNKEIPAHFGEGWGQRYGEIDDWKLDGKTPHKFRFEWRNGRLKFTDFKDREMTCGEGKCTDGLDRLRYISIGGDRYNGGPSLVGARFLSVTVEDFDAPEKQ